MKKMLKLSCFYLVVILIAAVGVGGIQKANAVTAVCPVYGAQHQGNSKSFIHVYWNSKMYNGTLYTCDCGAQVVCYDAYRYFYPYGVRVDHTAGYPVIGQQWYVPTTTYAGTPSTWYNIR